MQENNESRSLQAKNVTLTGASKWNDYVTKDDNDGLRIINNKSRGVEDDIHPDFLQG